MKALVSFLTRVPDEVESKRDARAAAAAGRVVIGIRSRGDGNAYERAAVALQMPARRRRTTPVAVGRCKTRPAAV